MTGKQGLQSGRRLNELDQVGRGGLFQPGKPQDDQHALGQAGGGSRDPSVQPPELPEAPPRPPGLRPKKRPRGHEKHHRPPPLVQAERIPLEKEKEEEEEEEERWRGRMP